MNKKRHTATPESSRLARRTLSATPGFIAFALLMALAPAVAQTQEASQGGASEIMAEAAKLQAQGTADARRRAIEKYAAALELYEAARDAKGQAQALVKLGEVHYALGETAKAGEHFQRAAALAREVGAHSVEADAMANVGVVHLSQGRPREAVEFFNRALPLRRVSADRGGEASTLTNIASAYLLMGEPHEALARYSLVVPLHREAGNRKNEAAALTNIGSAHSALGEPQQAVEFYRQALNISRELKDRAGEASALNNLGYAYNLLGNQPLALEYYRQCLPLREAGGDKRGQGYTLANIGSAQQELGESAQALEHLARALTLLREVKDRRGEAATLVSAGSAHAALGDHAKALEAYGQALALWQAVGDRRREATTLNRIGRLQLLTSDLAKARESLALALPLHRKFFDQAGEADTLYHLALVESKQGRAEAAQAAVEQSLGLVESLRARVFGPRLRASYLASVGQYYEFYVELLMRRHRQEPSAGFDALAFQASERARARSLLEMLSEANAGFRRGVPSSLIEQERRLRARINAKSERLSFAPRGGGDTAHVEAAKEIDSLLTEYTEVQARIRAASPAYAALTQPRPAGLKEMQKGALDRDTVLLEYALGEERSYLWFVTHDSLRSFELPRRSEVEAAARRVYELLTARSRRVRFEPPERREARVRQADSDFPAAAAALSEMVLAPAAEELKGKRLLVAAEGALQYVPFGALPEPSVGGMSKGGGRGGSPAVTTLTHQRPLVVGHEVVYLPSASVLLTLRHESAGRGVHASKGVAVFADPVFSTDDPRVQAALAGSKERRETAAVGGPTAGESNALRALLGVSGAADESAVIPRLPNTRVEAEAIAALAPRGEGALKALDFDASRRRVAGVELNRYRVVHFATHGVLNSRHPELSGLLLSMVGEDGAPVDGFLRAHEVYDLSIPAELVVLSGCRTGLGEEVRGEGLVGLTRGFMYAGAPRVAVSLWDVSDAATAELMRRFYRGLLVERKRPSAALRAAQSSMAADERWSQPYYWAAFVMQGEWR